MDGAGVAADREIDPNRIDDSVSPFWLAGSTGASWLLAGKWWMYRRWRTRTRSVWAGWPIPIRVRSARCSSPAALRIDPGRPPVTGVVSTRARAQSRKCSGPGPRMPANRHGSTCTRLHTSPA